MEYLPNILISLVVGILLCYIFIQVKLKKNPLREILSVSLVAVILIVLLKESEIPKPAVPEPFVTVKMSEDELIEIPTGEITITTTSQEVSILVRCKNQQGVLLERGEYGIYDVKRKFLHVPGHFAPLTVLLPDPVDLEKGRHISSWKNQVKLLITVPIGWTYFDLFKGRQDGILIEITENDGAFRKYIARITPEGKVIKFN